MIKDFSIHKQIEKHARHVESAHRELSHHLAELQRNPTAGELHRLLHYQIRARISRLREIKNCPKRGPAFASKFPDHHAHGEESAISLENLVNCITPIIRKYFIPETEEIDRDRALDPEDQKTIIDALQSELQT